MAIGTFVANFNAALYNLYVMDPSEQQILRYTMLADGSSYPAAATGYLTTPQDVSKVTSMYIDGEVYLAAGGLIERFVAGRRRAPPDPSLHAHRLAGPAPRGHALRLRRRECSRAGVRQADRGLPRA